MRRWEVRERRGERECVVCVVPAGTVEHHLSISTGFGRLPFAAPPTFHFNINNSHHPIKAVGFNEPEESPVFNFSLNRCRSPAPKVSPLLRYSTRSELGPHTWPQRIPGEGSWVENGA